MNRFWEKIYVDANIKNTKIFHLFKYDLNGPWRSQNVTFMFISTMTYVLMDNFLSLFSKQDVGIVFFYIMFIFESDLFGECN